MREEELGAEGCFERHSAEEMLVGLFLTKLPRTGDDEDASDERQLERKIRGGTTPETLLETVRYLCHLECAFLSYAMERTAGGCF